MNKFHPYYSGVLFRCIDGYALSIGKPLLETFYLEQIEEAASRLAQIRKK